MTRTRKPAARPAAPTARIIGAYLAAHPQASHELAGLTRGVHAALAGLCPAAPSPSEIRIPAAPIERSVCDGFLICLEDGRKFRSLRRHLRTVYNLTPEAYRARWGLPADYPMVAPAYSANRSALAKAIGLGAAGRRSGVVLWQAGSRMRVA